jgi:isopentenyl-diphosphate delta-isomerase
MGFTFDLAEIFVFEYQADLGKQMIENEIDHVLIGRYDDDPVPNPDEVSDFVWIDLSELVQRMRDRPQDYTYWLKKSLGQVVNHLRFCLQRGSDLPISLRLAFVKIE